MIRQHPLFLGLLTLVFLVSTSQAGDQGYECVVIEEAHLHENGGLRPYPKALQIGSRFAVDRRDGHIANLNSSWWYTNNSAVTVHAYGDDKNSFSASYLGPGETAFITSISTLWIEEYEEGIKKPFLFTTRGSAYSGLCE